MDVIPKSNHEIVYRKVDLEMAAFMNFPSWIT